MAAVVGRADTRWSAAPSDGEVQIVNSDAGGEVGQGHESHEPLLPEALQHRLLTVLQDELARASSEALARGVTPQALAQYMEARVAQLRSVIADTDRCAGQNVADDSDNAIKLHGIGDE